MTRYFSYGDEAVNYLRSRDKKLGTVIDKIGHVRRAVDSDLFSAVVHHIIGQQISTKAQTTIWNRLQDALGCINVQTVCAAGAERIQACGTTFRKAGYICDFARKVQNGTFDLDGLPHKKDNEVIRELTSLSGIGTWTAEMIMLFCLQRPDILSYDDLAIRRGMRMIYRHRVITRPLFEKYRRRYTPWGSVASLYLWAAACGAVPGLTDPGNAAKEKKGA
jgi:DNA-3-methyladenine glycosylase II